MNQTSPVLSGQNGDNSWAIWKHPGGIVASRVRGRMEVDFSQALERTVDEMLAKEPNYTAIHDWSRVESFDTKCQKDLTAFGLRTNRQMRTSIVWTTSVLVKMAVAVANMTLGGKVAVPKSEEEFAAAVKKATGLEIEGLFGSRV
jgi:hypothetical protein